jgi:hypothetical protein
VIERTPRVGQRGKRSGASGGGPTRKPDGRRLGDRVGVVDAVTPVMGRRCGRLCV